MAQGVEKQLEKLRTTLDTGAFYEAQQIFKTVFHRYRSRKKLEDSYRLMEEGVILQLQHGQISCALELGLLLVDAYVTDDVSPDAPAVARVLHILDAINPSHVPPHAASSPLGSTPSFTPPSPAPTNPPHPQDSATHTPAGEAARIMRDPCDAAAAQLALAAIKWARKSAPGGAAPIHAAYAGWLTSRSGSPALATATPHYVRGDDVQGLAAAVKAAAAEAPKEELGLFATRAILQVLVVPNPGGLDKTLEQARELQRLIFGEKGTAPTPDPADRVGVLESFDELLLRAVEKRSLPLEQLLRQVYAKAISRDPVLGAALDKVESLHLGKRASPQGMEGMLQGLMGMLGSGQDM